MFYARCKVNIEIDRSFVKTIERSWSRKHADHRGGTSCYAVLVGIMLLTKSYHTCSLHNREINRSYVTVHARLCVSVFLILIKYPYIHHKNLNDTHVHTYTYMFFRDGVYLILLVFLCVTSRVSIFFFYFLFFSRRISLVYLRVYEENAIPHIGIALLWHSIQLFIYLFIQS